jgi:phage major head subunit gpT-like protein
MLISSATLDGLRTEFKLGFNTAYAATEPWWSKLATQVPSSAKSNTYGWIAQVIKLRKWLGPRVSVNLSEHVSTIINSPFEGTVEVLRDDIEDDNLGLYSALIVPELAQATKKHPDQLLAAMLAANPLCFDGIALFSASHPTYATAGAVYSNSFALTLNADNFNTVWSAMVSYTGEDGQPLLVNPMTLFVPPQLKLVANQIMNSTTAAVPIKNVAASENVGGASIDNMMKGWAEVVVLPELAGSPKTWYLADTSKAIKPSIYQVRRAPEFVSRFDPTDPKVFDQRVFTFGVDYRGEVGPTLPFLIARSVGP